MRCLFCKQDSSSSKSIEHIIPESLGNVGKVLERGIVCDQCNHYFGTKIEKSFIENDEISNLRFNAIIPSKRGKVPPIDCIVDRSFPAKIYREIDPHSNQVRSKLQFSDVIKESIPFVEGQRILIEYASVPKETTIISTTEVSRFIAKVALELFAYKQVEAGSNTDSLVDDPSFDALRDYARYGSTIVWPCNIRRIYKPDKRWPEENESDSNIVFEGMFLLFCDEDPDSGNEEKIAGELYCIFSIWGIEFAINMGHRSTEKYQNLLQNSNDVSPLHSKKD